MVKKSKRKSSTVKRRKTPDFLYKNAPLVEVIVEVAWNLNKLEAIPNSFIDPHFKSFSDDFTQNIIKAGYPVIERIVSEQVPLELIGGSPVFRCRVEKDSWPLFQIGPGIFTANIVLPYNGWDEFRKVISVGLDTLFESYPMSKKYLIINKTSLRYIDAFTEAHGMKNYSEFLYNNLALNINIPDEIENKFVLDKKDIKSTININFPVKESMNSMLVKIGSGKSKDKEALLIEMNISATNSDTPRTSTKIKRWLDNAHVTVSDFFQLIITEETEEILGPRKSI